MTVLQSVFKKKNTCITSYSMPGYMEQFQNVLMASLTVCECVYVSCTVCACQWCVSHRDKLEPLGESNQMDGEL